MGCHSLLQGIFPIQGSNPGLLHCRQILYQLSCQGSPLIIWIFVKVMSLFLITFFISQVNSNYLNKYKRKKNIDCLKPRHQRASLVAQMVKNLPAMQETWIWSLGWEDPLEKGMAIHSCILAWRIPRTEKPGRLQSTWLQRVSQWERERIWRMKRTGTSR